MVVAKVYDPLHYPFLQTASLPIPPGMWSTMQKGEYASEVAAYEQLEKRNFFSLQQAQSRSV